MNSQFDVYSVIDGFKQIDSMRKDIQNLVSSLSSLTKEKQWIPEIWERIGTNCTLWRSKDGYVWNVEFRAGAGVRPFMKKIKFISKAGVTLFEAEVDSKSGLLEFLFLPADAVVNVYGHLQGFLDGLAEVSLSLHHDLLPFKEASKRHFK